MTCRARSFELSRLVDGCSGVELQPLAALPASHVKTCTSRGSVPHYYASLRKRRDGSDYLKLMLGDRTGSVPAMVWEDVERVRECCVAGEVVHVTGRFAIHPRYGPQLGIQRDHAFVRDELEMMLAFMMAAHDEPDEHKVVKTWVKQVRDVAYDA